MVIGHDLCSYYTGDESVLLLPIPECHYWFGEYCQSPHASLISHTSQLVAQLLSFPLGRLMARICPNVSIFGHPLNPGPFTIKEHVVVTIMANVGAQSAYAVRVSIPSSCLMSRNAHHAEYRLTLSRCNGFTTVVSTTLDTNGWSSCPPSSLASRSAGSPSASSFRHRQ